MNFLITGGEASGKSAYAEKIALELAQTEQLPLFYVATLDKESGGDTAERIEKHKNMRAGKGFETIEQTKNLKKLTLPQKNGVVLLEDLGNLCANELFSTPTSPIAIERDDTNTNYASSGKIKSTASGAANLSASITVFADGVAQKIVHSLASLAAQARHFIVVSPDIFLEPQTFIAPDGSEIPFSTDLLIFMQTLASACNSWAEKCENVVQIVAGIPVPVKE